LGGSHYVEYLTERMQEEMRRVMGEIDAYGGVVKAIEDGWLQARIARRALERKKKIDARETIVVGVNSFASTEATPEAGDTFQIDPATAKRVKERFQRQRQQRDEAAAQRALDALGSAAAVDGENLMPYLVDCCHAYATVGEMTERLKRLWGSFEEPIRL
jgi:methylmalonyl-CoA mutase N-terminal domain/subunit